MSRQARTLPSGTGISVVPGTTGSGGSVTIPNYGATNITNTAASTLVLAPPVEGVMKRIYTTSTTSAAVVVKLSTGTANTVSCNNQDAHSITFNATVDMCVELLGVNSTRWIITNCRPENITVNSTGVVTSS